MSSIDLAEFVRFVMDYGTDRIGLESEADSRGAESPADRRPAIVRLAVDMLLATRRTGLSSRESGWLFLLLASQLIGDLSPDAIAELVHRSRLLLGAEPIPRRKAG